MFRKSDLEILQKYIDYLNRVFNRTITDSRLAIVRPSEKQRRLIACFQNNKILPLKLKPQGYLHFRQLASVRYGRVIVEDCNYCYSFSADPDNEQQWVFRYEYCLVSEENIPHAHLHINANRGSQQLRHIHFPTGRVSIEQIIAHLIVEHGVKSTGSDWLDFLAKSHRGFIKRRTDPVAQLFP